MSKLTQDDIDKAYADYVGGMTWEDLAAKWNVHFTSLYKRFKHRGLLVNRHNGDWRYPPPKARPPRPPRPPTQIEMAVLRYIIRYKSENCGDSPTTREIVKDVGISSTSMVNYYLDALETHGLILRSPPGKPGKIGIVGGRWVYEGKQ